MFLRCIGILHDKGTYLFLQKLFTFIGIVFIFHVINPVSSVEKQSLIVKTITLKSPILEIINDSCCQQLWANIDWRIFINASFSNGLIHLCRCNIFLRSEGLEVWEKSVRFQTDTKRHKTTFNRNTCCLSNGCDTNRHMYDMICEETTWPCRGTHVSSKQVECLPLIQIKTTQETTNKNW